MAGHEEFMAVTKLGAAEAARRLNGNGGR